MESDLYSSEDSIEEYDDEESDEPEDCGDYNEVDKKAFLSHNLYENWKHIPGDKYLNVERKENMPSAKIPIDESLEDPYNLFCLFFPDELFQLIVTETNRYFHQFIEENPNSILAKNGCRNYQWKDLTIDTARGFVAATFLMGLIPRHDMLDHFKSGILQSNIKKYISKERFVDIWRFLHLHDNR